VNKDEELPLYNGNIIAKVLQLDRLPSRSRKMRRTKLRTQNGAKNGASLSGEGMVKAKTAPPSAKAVKKTRSVSQPAIDTRGGKSASLAPAPASESVLAKPPESGKILGPMPTIRSDVYISKKKKPEKKEEKKHPSLNLMDMDAGQNDIMNGKGTHRENLVNGDDPIPEDDSIDGIARTKLVGIKIGEKKEGVSDYVKAGMEKREKELQDAQAKKLKEKKEREKAEEQWQNDKDVLKQKLGPKLKAWAEDEGHKKKNIRTLLASMDTVMWEESTFKGPGMSQLINFNGIKKAHRKAIIAVHPDKNGKPGIPAERKFIAEFIFSTLQQAYEEFEKAEMGK